MRFVARLAAVCGGIITVGCATAVPPAPMVTDRPDFTESAVTVTPGRAQLEAGYSRTGDGPVVTHEIGESLVRVGVTGATELRVGIGSWRIEDTGASAADSTTGGLAGSSLGLKLRLPSTPLVPEAALLLSATVPLSARFGDPGWTPSAVLAGAWSAGAVGLGANLGYVHAESDAGTGEVLASVAVGLPLPPDQRAGLFVETYAVAAAGGGDALVVVDGGATFAASPDVQLDVRIGRGVSGTSETVIGVGVSVRR